MPLKKMPIGIPADFDWKIYLNKYPDLGKHGIDSKEKAQQHWILYGKNEGRLYKDLSILILGEAKTGTTALYYKIKSAMPPKSLFFFEPKSVDQVLEHPQSDRFVLCKTHFHHFPPDVLGKLIRKFNKRIFIARDPRDTWLSQIFWLATEHYEDLKWNYDFYHCLKKLEAGRKDICMGDLGKMIFKNYPGRWARPKETYYSSVKEHNLFVYKYEDMICKNDKKLNKYLGFEISGEPEDNSVIQRVSRTKTFGLWRHWFRPADAALLRPWAEEYLRRYGYDHKDWAIDPSKKMDPRHASGYFINLINTKRENAGLPKIDEKMIPG